MGKKPFLLKMDVGHRSVFSRNTAEEDIGTCLSPWSKTKRQFLLEKSDTLEGILYRMRSITKTRGQLCKEMILLGTPLGSLIFSFIFTNSPTFYTDPCTARCMYLMWSCARGHMGTVHLKIYKCASFQGQNRNIKSYCHRLGIEEESSELHWFQWKCCMNKDFIMRPERCISPCWHYHMWLMLSKSMPLFWGLQWCIDLLPALSRCEWSSPLCKEVWEWATPKSIIYLTPLYTCPPNIKENKQICYEGNVS